MALSIVIEYDWIVLVFFITEFVKTINFAFEVFNGFYIESMYIALYLSSNCYLQIHSSSVKQRCRLVLFGYE